MDPIITTKSRKFKIGRFFDALAIEKIQVVVRVIHRTVTRAALLIKDYYLQTELPRFEACLRDGTTYTPLDLSAALHTACTVVRDAPVKRRKADGGGGVQAIDSALSDCFHEAFRPFMATDTRVNLRDCGYSHVMSYAVESLKTAYLNNIEQRFPAYIRRSVITDLSAEVARRQHVAMFHQLSAQERKQWMVRLRTAANDILFQRRGEYMRSREDWIREWVEENRVELIPSRPDRYRFEYDLEKRPFHYLPYMARIVQRLEARGVTDLPSAFPLRRSFIPNHVFIDTTAIMHILMSKDEIAAFKEQFQKKRGIPLPGMTTKADMCRSYAVLSKKASVTPQEEERFLDDIWAFLAKLGGRKTKHLMPRDGVLRKPGDLFFEHAICTDGYSVSAIVSDRPVRSRKEWTSRKRRSAENGGEDSIESEIPMITPDNAGALAGYLLDEEHVKVTFGDPGKGTLLMVTDGEKFVKYTARQRRQETGVAKRMRKARILKKIKPLEGLNVRVPLPPGVQGPERLVQSPTVTKVERQIMGACCANSCHPERFRQYVRIRMEVEIRMEEFYSHKLFRANRFTSWARREISEDRFAKKLKDTFCPEGTRRLVIVKGNWGRRPNLRNQAPTPGIGLARALRKRGIDVIEVIEPYTSSVCVHCNSEVANMMGKHHLLRCCNHGCIRRWYDRDKMGALNIRRQVLHLLAHGEYHPMFEFREE